VPVNKIDTHFNIADKKQQTKKVLTAQEELEVRRKELQKLEEKAKQERLKAEEQARLEEERKRKIAEEKAQKVKEAEEKQKQISKLLSKAEEDIEGNRLVYPKDNNAYLKYQKVLEISLEHAEAKKGIARIGNIFITESQVAIESKNFERADKLLIEAKKIMPDTANLKKAQQSLINAKEKARIEEERRVATEKAKKQKEKEEKQKRISDLLKKADENITAKRLIEPKDNNALDNYKKVLEISPEDRDAKQGIINISNALISQSQIAIGKNEFKEAEIILNEAKKISPNAKNIKQTQNLLTTAKLKAKQDIVSNLLIQMNEAIESRKFEKAKEIIATVKKLDPDSKDFQATYKHYESSYAEWQEELKRIEEIKQLLASAQKNLEKKRLTTPKGNNALEQYQRVLELEPDNVQGQEGVRVIFDRYVELAQVSSDADNYEKAEAHLNKANKILPDDSAIIEKLEELKPRLAELEERKKEKEAKRLAE